MPLGFLTSCSRRKTMPTILLRWRAVSIALLPSLLAVAFLTLPRVIPQHTVRSGQFARGDRQRIHCQRGIVEVHHESVREGAGRRFDMTRIIHIPQINE